MNARFTAACLGAALIVTMAHASPARADVTTERSASILVWPKIIANGTRDTVIELVNTSNSLVRAHCFYVNASLRDPSLPEGPLNPRLWLEVDFTLTLTRQQPTYWVVSEGRPVNPLDPICSPDLMLKDACAYAGFDPGLIPPVVPDFVGELKCVQVDDSGAPFAGNALQGRAILQNGLLPPVPGGIFLIGSSSYNAIGILGIENNGDGTLVLGGGQCVGSGPQTGDICSSDEDCGSSGPCALEYNACPETWILNHLADGAPDIVLEDDPRDGTTSVETELTIIPCTQNFETQKPTTVTIQFQTWNEFESQFSTSTSITCWGNFRLGDIGAPALTFAGQLVPDNLGTMYLQTRLRSAAATPYGVLMVMEEYHTAKPSVSVVDMAPVNVSFVSTAAGNLHVEGDRAVPDIITIPDEQLAR